MKKIIGNWNIFEIILFFVSIISIIVTFIVGADKNWLSLATSIVGVTGVISLSKSLVVTPFINVIQALLYSSLSLSQGYYGEVIVYLGFLLPMEILTIIFWVKNRKKEDNTQVKINSIKGMEYVCAFLVVGAFTVGLYFILKALDTNQLIINTISAAWLIYATYLVLRRSSYYAIGYIIDDVILITLWSITVAESGVEYLPVVICFSLYLVNDIYGFIRWRVEYRKQIKDEDKELKYEKE